MKKIKIIIYLILTLLLCSCNGFFDKDNTPPPSPLVKFCPEAHPRLLWTSQVGSGLQNEYLKLSPAISERLIFSANRDGSVTATDKVTGRNIWRVNTRILISGGTAAADGLVFVGGNNGEVVALQQANGKEWWRTCVSSEVLATPAVARGIVLVKSIDGKLTALSEQDGHPLWHFDQTEPSLILRGASSPQLINNNVIVGFANGNLVKLSLQEGSMHWQQAVATPTGSFSIQRMIDIDADPIVANSRVYAATYQGKIAALDLVNGKIIWNSDISSYSGIAADNERVYVSDAKSHVWAFDASTGNVDWRQMQLEARNITGPVVMGNFIVVGDEQGYLHWLCKEDGHFVARTKVSDCGILATPKVDCYNILYVLSRDGKLATYRLG